MDRPERFLISNAHSGTLVEVAIGSRLASTHESTSLQRWFIGLLVIVATCQVLGDGVLRSAVHGRDHRDGADNAYWTADGGPDVAAARCCGVQVLGHDGVTF